VTWSAQQYIKFEDERTRPVRDLLAALAGVEAHTALDLGCGPGNSTELLAARFPGAAVRGLDRSADMVRAAQARLPALGFDLDDIEHWVEAGGRVDVILANASLQWVPDHARLFPALRDKLTHGGCLAVQMPDNLEEPAHRHMRETAAAGPWARALADAAPTRASLETPQRYYELLAAAGCRVDVWRTTYHHPLRGGVAAVVEWFEGSALRPYLDPLGPGERREFLQRYANALGPCLSVMPDGSVLLPFPRLFIVARA
jgi:trans-aconitate 2-methyltransferase